MITFLSTLFKNGNQKTNDDFGSEAIPHMDSLYNFALRMTGNCNDAGVLLRETYIKAYDFRTKLEKGINYRAWLFRIMRNTFINDYSNKVRPGKIDYDEFEKSYRKIIPASLSSINLDSNYYDKLTPDKLTEAITSLPKEFRIVVVMCDIEGYAYEEIADFVDIPVNTVRSRLYRARKILFTKLQGYTSEEGYIRKENNNV